MVGLKGSLKITEPQNHIMVVLGGSLKIIEPWSCQIVLEGSLKITEPQNGGVGRVLKDHRAVELSDCVGRVLYSHGITAWLGWEGP